MKPRVLFLVGPTASGKSEVALRLAKRLGGEIISADSMQVYRGMDIGTAKPPSLAQKRVPHHLIDLVSPAKTFSVYQYRNLALQKIREILKRRKLPIVAGGSGLYIRALLEGLSGQPGGDGALRREFEKEAQSKGSGALHRRLQKIDPKIAQKIHPQDQKRIIRALEISLTSNKNPSEWYAQRESLSALGYEPVVIGIAKERQELYQGIARRVDRMFRAGLVGEVKSLAKKKFSRTAGQAVGYKEVMAALKGTCSLEEARELVKRNTRRLAKRQMTWFRKEAGIQWILWKQGDDTEKVADKIRKAWNDAR